MTKPNEPEPEKKSPGETPVPSGPATPNEIAEVDATILLVSHGFCGLPEGRFRLDAIRAKYNFRREHKKPQSPQSKSAQSAGGTAQNIAALADTCNKNPDVLRNVISVLQPEQAQELLKLINKTE
jgi:hypothetical protein